MTAGADEYLDEQASVSTGLVQSVGRVQSAQLHFPSFQSDIKKLQRSIVAKLTGMDAPGEQPDKEDDDVSARIPDD